MANIPVAIGRHPVHGLVAHNTQQNPNADHLLRGLGFARIPGHYLYRMEGAEGIETEVGFTAVRLLRSIGYDVDADVSFDGDLDPADLQTSAAEQQVVVAEPALSTEPEQVPVMEAVVTFDRSPLPEPAVSFDRHPELGIVATAGPTATDDAREQLTAAGFSLIGDSSYVLPYGTPLDAGLDVVHQASEGLRAARIPFEAHDAIHRPVPGQPITRDPAPVRALNAILLRLDSAVQRIEPAARRAITWARKQLDALRTPAEPQQRWLPGSLPPPRERPAPGMVWQQVPITPRAAERPADTSAPGRAIPRSSGWAAPAPVPSGASRVRGARSTSAQTVPARSGGASPVAGPAKQNGSVSRPGSDSSIRR